jgi:hypothetical protein
MQSNARRTIARDLTKPTSLVGFGKKLRELILEGGCKVDGEVAMKTKVESAHFQRGGLSFINDEHAYSPIISKCVMRYPGFIATHSLHDRCRP